MRTCCYCQKSFENSLCRPYGPAGAQACFPCAMLPQNKPTTDAELQKTIDKVISTGMPIYIGGHDGPSNDEPEAGKGEVVAMFRPRTDGTVN